MLLIPEALPTRIPLQSKRLIPYVYNQFLGNTPDSYSPSRYNSIAYLNFYENATCKSQKKSKNLKARQDIGKIMQKTDTIKPSKTGLQLSSHSTNAASVKTNEDISPTQINSKYTNIPTGKQDLPHSPPDQAKLRVTTRL
jgi:hypothetical protein